MARLLEGLKAENSIDRIKKHLELGRKILIFHDYNEGSPEHPFEFGDPSAYEEISPKTAEELARFYKETNYRNLPLNSLINPISKLTSEFGENQIAQFNGRIPKKKRAKNLDLWNTKGSGLDILLVQRQAGKEGINAHDVIGD